MEEQSFEHIVDTMRLLSLEDESCSFSVGSIWLSEKIDVLKEIAKSDEIMYAEKQSYYKTLQPGHSNRRTNAAEHLLTEIRKGCFCAYFQPKVDMETGKIIGAEALVRKMDDEGHLIPPDKFIPTYEYDGTIRHVDYFILESVCS